MCYLTRLIGCVTVTLFCSLPQAAAQESVPGEYVVVMRRNAVNIAEINALGTDAKGDWKKGLAERLLPDRDAEVIQLVGLVNAVGIRVPAEKIAPAGQPRVELMAATNEEVLLVEPNFIYYQDQTTSPDPEIPQMWFLGPIQAQPAWQVRNSSEGVVVAVIDTGVYLQHEDLADQIWVNEIEQSGEQHDDDDDNQFVDDVHGFDFFNSDPDPSADFVTRENGVQEFESHGTHVAGTIGAMGDNGKGIVGISRKITIMPIKALGGPRGSGDTINLIAAIDYAVQNGATIINASWGGWRSLAGDGTNGTRLRSHNQDDCAEQGSFVRKVCLAVGWKACLFAWKTKR